MNEFSFRPHPNPDSAPSQPQTSNVINITNQLETKQILEGRPPGGHTLIIEVQPTEGDIQEVQHGEERDDVYDVVSMPLRLLRSIMETPIAAGVEPTHSAHPNGPYERALNRDEQLRPSEAESGAKPVKDAVVNNHEIRHSDIHVPTSTIPAGGKSPRAP